MGVSQQAIADALGLSRTTVTKILNRDPKYSASEATRDMVFRTAERMGYDFTTIRRPFKREYGRTEINAKCQIEIVVDNGQVFDSGECFARNIGVGGALLANLKMPKMVLPLANFTIRLRFVDLPALAGLVGECQVVRMTDSMDVANPELGVKFVNASVSDRKLLKDFIDERVSMAAKTKVAAAAPIPPSAQAAAPAGGGAAQQT